MKPFRFLLPIFWSLHLHLLLLVMCFGPNRTLALKTGNQTDHFSLLKFKESIFSDPNGILGSWNSSTHFCNWHGITCNAIYQRVTKLELQGHELRGYISPYVGNLSFLRNLNLGNNSFNKNIPKELGSLSQLRSLILLNNSLVGEFPTNLTKCSNLEVINLAGNNLTGKLPRQIGSLGKLQKFYMQTNNLFGKIPLSIRNLSSLVILSLAYNNLEGNVPQEICYLKHLIDISVHVNKLSGSFPSCLYNMSSLIVISATDNHFINGSLPPSMFHSLPNLQFFGIGVNQISGTIPTSISNAVNLAAVDISDNHFVGQVPRLSKLQQLWILNLSMNKLGDNSTRDLEFLESLTNCSKLKILSLTYNRFGASLPNSIGNLSPQLRYLYLGGNQISGKVPIQLGNLTGLIALGLGGNLFEGTIPAIFKNFKKIQGLELSDNNLSGEIPLFIGNLTELFSLVLGGNNFHGNIPSSIGNCQKLQTLDLSQNNLRGTIPSEIFSLYSIRELYLYQNSLSGILPKEVGKVTNINLIDVSNNLLSGDIPGTIGECESLENLYLQGNSFQGKIPSQLASLKGLQKLDLSQNQLSGKIPKALQNISFLEYFNVSFNMLEGEVPTEGIFQNVSKFTVIGNTKLCGGISQLHLPPCNVDDMKPTRHHSYRLIVVIVSLVSFLLLLAFILSIYCIRKRNKKLPSHSPTIDQLAKISYQDIYRGTDGFSTRNLIGSGNYGSVFKGILVPEVKVIAVKVMNLQKKGAHKSFITECIALKNIRHRNLVKILTCCSSTDYKGQEFKALVFEYMQNGSLEQWLYPLTENVEHPRTLDLDQRINIIIDVASALHYLHHDCEQMVIHCDLKPSNVLLDDDMVAHVSDFGIARLVSTIEGTSHMETSSTIGIKGTVGYAPPEYGMGSEISTSGDMYSFGMLVLEMLTGKRPTDEMFAEGKNMHSFVASSVPHNLALTLDPRLVPRDVEATIEDGNRGDLIPNVEKCLLSLFRIGLACSMESPKERMNIVDVTRELNIIRNAFPSREII